MTIKASKAVSEFDVVLATAVWLVNRSTIQTMKISPPKGQTIHPKEQEGILSERLGELGFSGRVIFVPTGPDITTCEEVCEWRVECKGLTGGAPETVKNNFDRALASVVSYYDEPDTNQANDLGNMLASLSRPNRPVRLLLALPESDRYRKLLKKCLRPALRRKPDLWVLILDPPTNPTIYTPDQEV